MKKQFLQSYSKRILHGHATCKLWYRDSDNYSQIQEFNKWYADYEEYAEKYRPAYFVKTTIYVCASFGYITTNHIYGLRVKTSIIVSNENSKLDLYNLLYNNIECCGDTPEYFKQHFIKWLYMIIKQHVNKFYHKISAKELLISLMD